MTDFLIAPWSQPSTQTRLVTPPTDEPLTVEELKLRASMSWPTTVPPDPRDAMLADFIRAARQKVELDTGLSLLTQVREVTFGTAYVNYYYDYDAPYYVPLPECCLPVQSIEEIAPAILRRVRWAAIPGSGRMSVREVTPAPGMVLRVTCGWPSLDALKTEAATLHQAVALLAAHYATLGRDLAITGAVASVNVIPEGYEALIAPHRVIWVI